MATTVIDLIRHGEPEGGRMFRGGKDDPLSQQGWQQMQAAIPAGEDWDVIVSSPLARCRRFAEHLALQQGIPLHVDEDLREISFGDWEGLTSEQVKESYGDHLDRFWRDPVNAPPPAAESVQQFYLRVVRGFNRWVEDLDGKKVLIIGHGGVIRMILADVLGIPLEKSFSGFAVPFACRSRIQVDRSGFGVFRGLISHQP